MRVTEQFEAFRELIDEALPAPTAPWLPADDAAVARLETAIGQPLPPDVRAYLAVCGGQDDPESANGPIAHRHFLTVDEIVELYRADGELLSDYAVPARQPDYYAKDVWSAGWIPILAYGSNAIMIDLDPGRRGTRGQVFERPDSPRLDVPLAPSLGAFLVRLCRLIEAGRYRIEDNTIVPEWPTRS